MNNLPKPSLSSMQSKPAKSSKLLYGVSAGISTGLFWGIPFLAPQVLKDFSPLDIAFGRFFFFGLVSLFFIRPATRVWKVLTSQQRLTVVLLSASGYWMYSCLLFYGVTLTDGVVSSLIIGLLPVTIALLGSKGHKFTKGVWTGLVFICAGLLSLFGIPFYQNVQQGLPGNYNFWGIVVLVVPLGLWTYYAIANTQFLQANPRIKARDLASLMGLLSLVSMLPIWLAFSKPMAILDHPRLGLFLFFGLLLGAGGSWVANLLWNVCSQNCPPHISGPLIVSETFFGLLYSFIYEARWPHGYEALAIGLLVSGVFVSVRSALKG
jgi:drug/metabolite transporter (DMT)-like permease